MKRSLTVNAALNAIRQTLAIIFPLITFPYASRVLGSTEYGRYSFSASIISYFILIATFGINNYAVREGARIRDDKDKLENLVSDLFTISLITTVLSMVTLILITFSSDKMVSYKYLIFIQSISIVLSTIGVDWVNTIYEDFLYITIRYIIIQILALIAIFAFVKGPADIGKYCLILVLGSYGGNLVNICYIRKYVKLRINIRLDFKKYIIPLFLLFVNSLATVIYVNSDITMLGFFTDDKMVGIYAFSSKIYNMVKYLINAVLIVTVPRLAYVIGKSKEKYEKFLNIIFNVLLLLLAPCVVGMCVLSEPIIMLVGGSQYLSGDESLKILSFSLIFALIASVFSNCILIINRLEKRCLVGTVASATINVILNFVLIPKIGIAGAAITTVLAEFLNMFIQAAYSRRDLNINLTISKWAILTMTFEIIVVISFSVISKMIFVKFDTLSSVFRIVFSILGSAISFLIFAVVFKGKLKHILKV